jgi:hypothetical protein
MIQLPVDCHFVVFIWQLMTFIQVFKDEQSVVLRTLTGGWGVGVAFVLMGSA